LLVEILLEAALDATLIVHGVPHDPALPVSFHLKHDQPVPALAIALHLVFGATRLPIFADSAEVYPLARHGLCFPRLQALACRRWRIARPGHNHLTRGVGLHLRRVLIAGIPGNRKRTANRYPAGREGLHLDVAETPV